LFSPYLSASRGFGPAPGGISLIHELSKIDRSDKRQKRNRPRPLDCMGERALMLGTTTGQSPRNDFAAFGNEIP